MANPEDLFQPPMIRTPQLPELNDEFSEVLAELGPRQDAVACASVWGSVYAVVFLRELDLLNGEFGNTSKNRTSARDVAQEEADIAATRFRSWLNPDD